MDFDTTSPWGTWKLRGFAAACLTFIDCMPTTAFFRRLAFLLRKPVKRSGQDCCDREIWGLRMRLAIRGNLTEQRWLTMAGFHDAPERDALRAALKPGSVFVDIGANAGFYTFWALSLKHAGLRVISVEPNDEMLLRIRYNLDLNGLASAVKVFACAVTPEPCQMFMEGHSENLGQTVMRADGTGSAVPGITLHDILREARVDRVDAMKIDIEGFEVPVLDAFFRDAPRTLWPRLVIGEIIGEGGVPLKELLVGRGYRIERCTKMNGILILPESIAAAT